MHVIWQEQNFHILFNGVMLLANTLPKTLINYFRAYLPLRDLGLSALHKVTAVAAGMAPRSRVCEAGLELKCF